MDCPVCNGPGVLLGTLGSLDHFRCRDCGIDFNAPHVEPEDEDDCDEWGEEPEDEDDCDEWGEEYM